MAERYDATFAYSDRFVMYEHTTSKFHDGPGLELIDLWAVAAVGWQPATDANAPYWYLQLGEQRRKFYTETDADAQAQWEAMAVRWSYHVDRSPSAADTLYHPYRRFKEN